MMVIWQDKRWFVSGSKTFRGQLYYMLTYCGIDHDWVPARECKVVKEEG